MAAWLFLARKISQTSTSKPSTRYKNAVEHGSFWNLRREQLRRSVRDLFAFWVGATIAVFAILPRTIGPEDEKMVVAMLIALLIFFPAWGLFRLSRFAIGR